MRLVASLTAAALCLAAAAVTPTAATAATTPCGFLNGQFDVSGKAFTGYITWPGDPYDLDGKTEDKVFAVKGTFSSDCKASWSAGGQTSTGTWLQKNENMVVKVGILQMVLKVAPDGAVTGQAFNDEDKIAKVSLKVR